jgi:hypothetical protein
MKRKNAKEREESMRGACFLDGRAMFRGKWKVKVEMGRAFDPLFYIFLGKGHVVSSATYHGKVIISHNTTTLHYNKDWSHRIKYSYASS